MDFPIARKKQKILSACKIWAWKKKSNFLKKWKNNVFFNFTLMALKWPKMIFFAWIRFHAKVQSILNFFRHGHFFHTTIPFGCRSPWKMRFWDKFDILIFFKKLRLWHSKLNLRYLNEFLPDFDPIELKISEIGSIFQIC